MKNNMLTQEEINNIAQSVDIVDVISSYIPLTSKGKNFFGVCPFHSDHSPSMSVSKEKQIYKCFACGASGNVFNFVMNYENISFIDAVKTIAKKAGIILNIGNTKNTDNNKLEVLYDIYDISNKFYKNNINTEDGAKAKEFIKNRGFNLNIINDFDIGLSLKNNDSLTNILLKKNFKQTDLIRSGLVTKDEKGLKDIYINRIMFPIHNLKGELVGYSGRIYNGESSNKYFNTKETEIFKKSEILYNYHRAKTAIKEKNQVIVVEGFFAAIRLHTIGIDNVVATLGTAFTKQHALILKRLADEIILCFDGDNAGLEATNSCINELTNIDILPKIIRLEDNLDPDDYVLKYGKEKMLNKIETPMNTMDFKLEYFKKDKNLSNTEDMSKYINEIINELNRINDDIYRELTLKKMSDISHISIDVLKNKLTKKEYKKIIKTDSKKLSKYEIAERNLIYYMLNNKDILIKLCRQNIQFNNPMYQQLFENLIEYYKKYSDLKISNILTYYKDDEKIMNILNELILINIKENVKEDEIIDYINLIKKETIDKKINTINKKISTISGIKEQTKLLEKMVELKKQQLEGENENDK